MASVQNTEAKLKERWTSMFHPNQEGMGCCDTDNTILDWWDYMVNHYSEKTRHYHTLQHVDTMLSLMDECISWLCSPMAVALAIFFHDVIYDPKANDNEERSAEAFTEFASKHLRDKQIVCNVYDWILLTKTHVTPEHGDRFGSEDKHYFLDMDMEVLGWPATQYQVYADQIRQEYIHIPDKDYRVGRAQVLKKFLERPRIYATEHFHRKYEEQARKNVMDEIRQLERG